MATMILDCRLTDDEKIVRGESLSKLWQEIGEQEYEKKRSATQFKEKIDAMGFEAGELAKIIQQGFEPRPVEVVLEKDYIRRTVSTVRTDTGEVVSSRSMGVDDAQEEIAFDEDRHNGCIAYLGDGRG